MDGRTAPHPLPVDLIAILAMRSTERPLRPANNDPAKINCMTAILAGGSMTGHFAYTQNDRRNP